jgi:transcriptional regulator with XRE-family HTH domain
LEDYEIGVAIGKVLRKKRKERRKTIAKLAEDVDMDSNHLGKIERGKRFPSAVTLIQLLIALEIDDPIIREIEYEMSLVKKHDK